MMSLSLHPPSFVHSPPRFTRLLSRSSISRTWVCSAAPSSTTSIPQLADSIRNGTITASENLKDTLSRIAQTDSQLNSFLTVDVDQVQKRAAQIDLQIAQAQSVGPLAGIPIAIKDNLCTRNLPTTAASRILDGFIPSYDATAVARLEGAGAIILGKTNMDEFGMGSSTEASAYGVTRNPCDLTRVPGGSSGGSAAAVASGLCLAALGTDTGGSIRLPAAYCGVTGLRPSYGRVSRHGLLAYASSLDTVGPITNSVADAALIMSIIAGHDPMDATSVDVPVPNFVDSLADTSLFSLRVGVVREAFGQHLHPEIDAAVRSAVDTLADLGAAVDDVSLPRLDACVAAYYVLVMSEASANLARYDGVRYGIREPDTHNCNDLYARSRTEGFGPEVKRRIMAGTYSLSSGYYDAYYLRAQRVRALMADDLNKAFTNGFDILVCPVSPTPPFKLGEKIDDPVTMYLDDIMNVPSSLAGLPAISVPCGITRNGLPIGLQIIAPYMRDDNVLRVAHAFQNATSHHTLTKQLVDNALAVAA